MFVKEVQNINHVHYTWKSEPIPKNAEMHKFNNHNFNNGIWSMCIMHCRANILNKKGFKKIGTPEVKNWLHLGRDNFSNKQTTSVVFAKDFLAKMKWHELWNINVRRPPKVLAPIRWKILNLKSSIIQFTRKNVVCYKFRSNFVSSQL